MRKPISVVWLVLLVAVTAAATPGARAPQRQDPQAQVPASPPRDPRAQVPAQPVQDPRTQRPPSQGEPPIELTPNPCPQVSQPVLLPNDKIDTRRMERPLPVRVLRGDRDRTLSRIRALLTKNGFDQTSLDIDRGQVVGSRRDQATGNHDDVLVWIDGQAGDAGRLRIYLDQGHYEPVKGKGDQRLKMDDAELQQRFGPIINALTELPDDKA